MNIEYIDLRENTDMVPFRNAHYIVAELKDTDEDTEYDQLERLKDCMKELPVPYLVRCPRITADTARACLQAGAVRILLTKEESGRREELEKVLGAGMVLVSVDEIRPRTAAFNWSEMKLNSDGMVPVIVQDHLTDQVLMLAYMNEESFEATLRTGHMVYYSRSRQELWEKGLTSGHFQFVKSLMLDCDNDTILAKVAQLGAACHTGSYSCFFKTILPEEF